MNMRNIGLVSMIFCVAPVLCAVSEASLTQQEQEIIKKWVQEINVKNQHPLVQQLAKLAVSSVRDHFLVALGKMGLGKNKLAINREIAVENEKFQLRFSNESQQLAGKLVKKFRINEQQSKMIAEQILQVMQEIANFPLNKIITDEDRAMCFVGEDIAEVNIATMKKTVAIYSFILKCL